jgi:hypothetical protein
MKWPLLLLLGAALHAQEGTVTVTHPNGSHLAHNNRWKINVDNRPLGKIGKGEYLTLKLTPGRHVFTTDRADPLPIDVQPGAIEFVRASVSDRGGIGRVRNQLEIISCEKALADLTGTRPAHHGDTAPSCARVQ